MSEGKKKWQKGRGLWRRMLIEDTGFRWKVWLVLGLCILFSAYCVVQMLNPLKQYSYEGAAVFDESREAAEYPVFQQISLSPGVYEIALEYTSDNSIDNLCTAADGTVFSGGLLTNGEHFYKGLHQTGFYIYLYESTDALQIIVNYNAGTLQTGSLVIRESNRLWSMLLTILLAITAVILGLMYLWYYDKSYGIDKEKKTVAFWLGVIILIASLPYLRGVSISGADLTYHLMRIEGVKDGLLSGQFPVRLEPKWLYGYGYANAIFYCNALLLFPALLRLLGFTITASYNAYCIMLNIAAVWIAYYCFSRIFRSRYVGLMCSALYSLSIFRIYKLVITSAVGEGSAVTFMPLVLYGFYRAFTEDPRKKTYKTVWIPLALGYAGLIQTHVLSCEIAAFLTIMVCLVFIRKVFQKEIFLELAKGAAGALLTSLWFLVPFLDYYLHEDVHIKYVSARTIQSSGLYPAQLAFHWWRLGSSTQLDAGGMQSSHALGIGLILVVGFAVFCVLGFSGCFRRRKEPVILLGKICAVAGGLLMLMSLDAFPWDKIQKLHPAVASLVSSLQFPNRFLGWGTCFLAAVAGVLLWFFKQKKDKLPFYLGVVCVLLGVTTSSMYLLDYVCAEQNYYRLCNEEDMGFGYISGGEYILEGTDALTLDFDSPVAGENTELVFYEKKALEVRMVCENHGAEQDYVELPLLYYTGYQSRNAETGESLTVEKGNNNVVRVWLPSGFQGTVEVRFVSPVYWRISEGISYLSWLLIIFAIFSYKYRKKGILAGRRQEYE